jgi:hypothetical protein
LVDMYIVLAGCAEQGSSNPFAASLDGGYTAVHDEIQPAGSGTVQTASGAITASVTASGGSGSYTYSWSVSELTDLNNAFSVNSTGTTNTATYNTLVLNCDIPANVFDPPNDAVYEISCTVSDGVASDIVVSFNLAVNAIGA